MPDEILQTHKLHDRCEKALAERFTVHKLHTAKDKDALIAEVGARVRAIAGGGDEFLRRVRSTPSNAAVGAPW